MGSNESAREKRMLLVCDQHAEMKNAKAAGRRPRKCFVTQTLTGMVQLTKAGIKAVFTILKLQDEQRLYNSLRLVPKVTIPSVQQTLSSVTICAPKKQT